MDGPRAQTYGMDCSVSRRNGVPKEDLVDADTGLLPARLRRRGYAFPDVGVIEPVGEVSSLGLKASS